jgi:hypothetical protein
MDCVSRMAAAWLRLARVGRNAPMIATVEDAFR